MSHEKQNKKRSNEVAEIVSPDSTPERLELVLTEINTFSDACDDINIDINTNEERAHQRKQEVMFKIFTPAIPYNHLYIAKLTLLYGHSITLHDCFQFMNDPALSNIKNHLDKHIQFVRGEVFALINFYVQHNDPAFKKDIMSKVDKIPGLKEWVHPFLYPEEDQDPLEQAVQRVVTEDLKRQKVEQVETIKAFFKIEVEERLSALQTQVDAHLDCLDEFDERFEAASPQQTYREKVELYAEYCSTVLKQILHTKSVLAEYIDMADKCIREINDPTQVGDMVRVLIKFTQMRDTLSSEVNGIYRPMKALAENYSANECYLSPKLKVFMGPWLNPAHLSPLPESINAYENQYPEYYLPPAPSISEKETAASQNLGM